MRPVGIVVGDELAQNRAQVLLVQDDEVVEALAPQRPDDTLGHGVGLYRQLHSIATVRDGFGSPIHSIR